MLEALLLDGELDLAVLRARLPAVRPLRLRQTPIVVGETVLALGNPFWRRRIRRSRHHQRRAAR